MSGQTIDGVRRELLSGILKFADECWHGFPGEKELRALLDAPAKLDLVECDACPTSGGCVSVCMKAPAPSTQPQGEPVAYRYKEGHAAWENEKPWEPTTLAHGAVLLERKELAANGTFRANELEYYSALTVEPLYAEQPAPVAFDFEQAAKKLASCMDYPWDHMPEQGRDAMREHAKAIINAAQSASVAVALSADELRFLEVIAMNPGAKLNGGEAFDDEGNSLWGGLEKLGLIECVGSYKWKLAFNAVEMGIKAFVGRPPAPAVLPGNWKSLLLEEMCKRCNLERDEDNHLEGDDTQVGVEFARDWIAERINQVIAEQPAPVVVMPDRDSLRDIIAQAIGGDTYDCVRVWSAWGFGTMSQDDFVPVVEQEARLYEIADACLEEVTRLQSPKPTEGMPV